MKRTRSDLIRVGLFTVITGGILIASLLWVAGSRLLRPQDAYTVLFAESVSGLSAGSNVEYQGVVVGRVRDIQLTRDIPPKVAVLVDLEPGTQVRRDTTAELLGSIVTGIQYIELQGGSEAAQALPPGGVIPGDVASLQDFRDQLADISRVALTILSRLERNVFSEENTAKASQALADLGVAAQQLSGATQAFDAETTGRDIARMVERVTQAAASVDVVFADLHARRETLFTGVESTMEELHAAIVEARLLVSEARAELRGAIGSSGGLLEDLSQATQRLQETLDLIEADPSVLVRGRAIPEREFAR
jgi:phospholipid/cholesterol/gamma-HCH transport system substrate-binding protein